jgi:hypothetical protein
MPVPESSGSCSSMGLVAKSAMGERRIGTIGMQFRKMPQRRRPAQDVVERYRLKASSYAGRKGGPLLNAIPDEQGHGPES